MFYTKWAIVVLHQVTNCCFTPSDQLFRCIIARTSYSLKIWWLYLFVLDKHASVNCLAVLCIHPSILYGTEMQVGMHHRTLLNNMNIITKKLRNYLLDPKQDSNNQVRDTRSCEVPVTMLAFWNNHLQVDMPLHSDTLTWLSYS